MNTEQQLLYERLLAWHPDAGDASMTFSRRLARENGWSPAYTRRAVDEYKRFVFLAATTGLRVVPSKTVDQVWHLHLTYTQSYWEDLCGRIIGKKLHHNPGRGEKNERVAFADGYSRTLSVYREWFRTEPPEDIWPNAGTRVAQSFRRIPVNRYWLIPKPKISVFSIILLVVLSVTMGSCALLDAALLQSVIMPAFFTLLFIVLVVWLIFYLAARSSRRRHSRNTRSHSSGSSGDNSGDNSGDYNAYHFSSIPGTHHAPDDTDTAFRNAAATAGFTGFTGGSFGGGGAGGEYDDSGLLPERRDFGSVSGADGGFSDSDSDSGNDSSDSSGCSSSCGSSCSSSD